VIFEWQAIKYDSYGSNLTADEIYEDPRRDEKTDANAVRDQFEGLLMKNPISSTTSSGLFSSLYRR